jgi:hypothetical protein
LQRNSPITGKSSVGPYWLYPLIDSEEHELSFFAPEEIHQLIQQHNLKAGDEFILSRVQNGKPGSTKLEISILGKSEHVQERTDYLRDTMLQCLKDAAVLVESVKELSLRAEDARSIALSLFIARSRTNGF